MKQVIKQLSCHFNSHASPQSSKWSFHKLYPLVLFLQYHKPQWKGGHLGWLHLDRRASALARSEHKGKKRTWTPFPKERCFLQSLTAATNLAPLKTVHSLRLVSHYPPLPHTCKFSSNSWRLYTSWHFLSPSPYNIYGEKNGLFHRAESKITEIIYVKHFRHFRCAV